MFSRPAEETHFLGENICNLASEKWFSSRTWDLKCGLQAFPHHTAMAYHTVSIDH